MEFVNAGQLVSTSADLTAKLWQAEELKSLGQLAELADVPVAILTRTHKAAADNSDLRIQVLQITGQSPWLASPLLGKHQTLAEETSTPTSLLLEASAPATQPKTAPQARPPAPHDFTEVEPNNSVAEATRISLPAKVAGAIAGVDAVGNEVDADYFKFSAQAGEQWIFEVMASRNGSPLDSRIEVLGMDSQSLLRTRLQAVRESYFTFRGKDSATSDDFRLHKWEDMELDEYFYAEGEVSRLWLYPRGPDSGFKVYPGVGSRRTYFDTTPVSHALGATGYIVRELALAEQPLPNGLPVFPIYFENDDDPFRRHGADSRLEFVAPATADYIARVRDARGFSGDDFKYELEIRRPKPDFSLSVGNSKLSMPIGSGREWSVTATRSDGLEGPICIALEGVPNGFLATNPLIIEAGQERAFGTLYATPAAAILPDTSSNQEPTEDGSNALANAAEGAQEVATTMPPEPFVIKLIASSEVAGQRIEHELNETLEVTLVERSELQFQIVDATDSNREVEELSIRPGETISARILIQRQGVESRVSFGGDDSGRNLPHGAYVDNIGLNGLLIPEGQNEREFFITAAPKLQPGRRQFHLQNDSAGKATSRSLWLNVLPPQAKLDPSDSETR